MKRVVVTGATSMIGIALTEELLKTDVEKIYAVIRKNSLNKRRLPRDERVAVIECEIEKYRLLPGMIREECDVFYHVAWYGTGNKRDGDTLVAGENIRYVVEAIRAAKSLGCDKFIATGSQAEYGRLDTERISPDSPANPETPYGIAKYASGKMAIIEAEKLKMDCLWVRVFSIYGKYDRQQAMIPSAVRGMLTGKRVSFTPAEQKWDYLYSEDAGRALRMIGECAHGRKIYCLGSGEKRTLKEYIKIMRDTIDRTLPLGIGDIPYTDYTVMNLCADIDSLTADTGWKPRISFEDGIARTVEFLRVGGGGALT